MNFGNSTSNTFTIQMPLVIPLRSYCSSNTLSHISAVRVNIGESPKSLPSTLLGWNYAAK